MSEETINTEKTANTDNHKWYILSSTSGKENSTARLIKQRVKANNMEHLISDVVVPTQEKIIIQRGKKKTIEERIFPGYILIKMEANDDTLHLIRNSEGVTGFVGMTASAKRPSPLSEKEAKGILAFTQVKQEPVYKTQLSAGDAVKVTSGVWKDFIGPVSDINPNKGKATVLFSLFGRETPVEVDLLEIEKISNAE
jgi:transcriptional antiterminator NusG